jgi:hypothetical protein
MTYGLDLEGRGPLVLEDVKADAAFKRMHRGQQIIQNLVKRVSQK